MLSYILRRCLSAIPIMGIVAVLIFLMLRLTPGDPAAIIAGDSATSEQIALVRNRLGLDESLLVQFYKWLSGALTGDLGESFFFKKPVAVLIAERIGPTVSVSILTLLIAVSIALPLGIVAAHRRNTLVDRLVTGFAVLGFSVPVFVVGYGLIYVFALRLEWLPVQGYVPLAEGVGRWFQSILLPSLTLSVVFIALIVRITRTSIIEVLSEDYIRTARAKGQIERKVLFGHALKNAAAPIVTVIGLGLAVLIGGVVVTESVFALPGLGRLTVDAVLGRDFPTVQAVILLFSLFYVVINLCVDLLYTVFDPRIRY